MRFFLFIEFMVYGMVFKMPIKSITYKREPVGNIGFDERFLNDTTIEKTITTEFFHRNYEKMKVLRQLESAHISQIEKIKILENYKKDQELSGSGRYIPDVFAGNLRKDWEFTM